MFLRLLGLQRFFEADRGSAGGDVDPPATDAKPRASEILERHGSDAIKLAERLATREGDNYQLREERRQLKEQLAALHGKVPAADAVVLAGDDATAWAAYRQLGKLDELQAALSERETTKGELTTLKRDLELRDVASIANYKIAVLRQLAGDAQFVIKDADGKKSIVVKDGDKETPLADYAKAKWADFLPSLQTAPERPAIGTPQTRNAQRPLDQSGQQQQPARKVRF